jgi:hypothetical protein
VNRTLHPLTCAIVPDRVDQKAAIHGRTIQNSMERIDDG